MMNAGNFRHKSAKLSATHAGSSMPSVSKYSSFKYNSFKYNAPDLNTTATELFSTAQRLDYLRRYGKHCMSSSTLQPNMRFFDCPEIGYIAYQDKWGERIVLSDPIAAPEHQCKLLEMFITSSHKSLTFLHISQITAEILSQKFGFFSTPLGHESKITLSQWQLTGKKKQVFRTALNQAHKQQIEIRESHDEAANIQLHQVSEQWLKTRSCKHKPIQFLIRPENAMDESQVRKFYAYQNNQIIAFIYFDPIYHDHQVIGYVPNISRANQAFKQGLFYAMMATALQQFKDEGVEYVNLGLTPLVVPDEGSPSNNIILSKGLEQLFKLTYRFGQSYYNFAGIHFTKSRFRAETEPCYVASRKQIPIKAFLACFRLCNVI